MSLIRQMKLQDGTNDSILARINSLSELHVADSSLHTIGANSLSVQTASLSQLVDIETAIQAVETNQTDKSQLTQITNGTNELDINSSNEALSSIRQNIQTSANNSTTANLASGATFTGTSEETFGINAIQIYHFADQDCTVYLDQSLDDTNWDLTDSKECLANEACTSTIISVAPYFRLRITNNGLSTTTELRAAAGMTPMINPLPRALSDDRDGRLKVETTLIGQQNTDRHLWVTPNNAINVAEFYRLVGTNFDGTTKDTNFWTEVVTGSGSVTQAGGEIQIDTGTTANSTASYASVQTSRFVVGYALHFQAMVKFVTTGTTDNVRRTGAFHTTDGFFFELDGTTFSIGFRKASSDTLVSSGSFNGNYGPSYVMDTSYHKLAIEWGPKGVFFYVDGVLLHQDGQGHRSDYLSLPIKHENINDNGLTTDIAFDVLGSAILRQGPLKTDSIFKYINGAASTLCKVGPGNLHNINITNNSGSATIYDGTSAAGNIISLIDTLKVQGSLKFDAPFNDGLFIVTTGSAIITATYE